MSLSEFIGEMKQYEDRTIRVDVHEPESMFKHVEKFAKEYDMGVERAVLKTGDYVFKSVGVERKEEDYQKPSDVLTKADELKRGYPHAFVMVSENLGKLVKDARRYRSEKRAKAMTGVTASLTARGVHPIFCSDRETMAEVMVKIFDKLSDDKERNIVQPIRPEPKTEDWKLHVLTGLPHIGKIRAKTLLKEFETVKNVMTATPSQLANTDGIGEKIAEDIVEVINE